MSSRIELGGSLPVDNVQKLASSTLKHVPDRYIRPELELDEICIDDSLKIPVIDMINLAADHLGYQDEMEKLHQACKEWGFFQKILLSRDGMFLSEKPMYITRKTYIRELRYFAPCIVFSRKDFPPEGLKKRSLINHGTIQTIEKMKTAMEEFFKLPAEQKLAYAQQPNDIEGYGQAFVVSDEQKLDWGDMLFLTPLPLSQRSMKYWPTSPISFRPTFDEYSTELHKICISIANSMAKNLGVDAYELSNMYQNGTQAIRMNYYPPCLQADKVIGLTPHSDGAGLTLLVQVNEVQGLQIKKNNKWVPVDPVPNAVIVNIGDVMEIMSNGEYKSIEHRAVVNFEKERLSIAAFQGPGFGTKIGPLHPLIEKGANYKTLEFDDYIKMVISSKLDGKSALSHAKLN